MVTNSDPFAARLQELQPKQEQPQQLDPFSKRLEQREEAGSSLWNSFYDMLFSKEETALDQGIGQALRGMGTAIGGIPGNFIEFGKATGEMLPKGPELFSRKPNFIQKLGKGALDKVPTSEDLIKKFDVLTNNQFQPGSDAEQVIQDIAGDIGTLLLPAKSVGQVGRALAGGILGNLAAQGMKELDYGEGAQAAVKIGTILLTSIINPDGAKKFAVQKYNQAFANLPKNAEISSVNFEKGLDKLTQKLSSGLKDVESKKSILTAIKDVKRNAKNGIIKVQDLVEAKRNLNELRTAKVYDPELKGGKSVRGAMKKNFGELAQVLDNSISDYGKTNANFFNPYKEANQIWGGIEQSKSASHFINKLYKQHKLVSHLGALSGLFNFPGSSLATGVGGYSMLKSYELMHRIMNSEQLRKYYMNVIMNGTKQSAPGVINNIKKLEKGLEEDQSSR